MLRSTQSVAWWIFSVALVILCIAPVRAAQQPAPAISVTINKSMVFRLAERAKRVSVSQPEVADVHHHVTRVGRRLTIDLEHSEVSLDSEASRRA
jgi:Flp pilus assembly secretin CpaC